MLPKKNQWKRWSLPSKYSLVGLILGIIGISISIYGLIPNWKEPNIVEDTSPVGWSASDEEYSFTITTNCEDLNNDNAYDFSSECSGKIIKLKKSDFEWLNGSHWLEGYFEVEVHNKLYDGWQHIFLNSVSRSVLGPNELNVYDENPTIPVFKGSVYNKQEELNWIKFLMDSDNEVVFMHLSLPKRLVESE